MHVAFALFVLLFVIFFGTLCLALYILATIPEAEMYGKGAWILGGLSLGSIVFGYLCYDFWPF